MVILQHDSMAARKLPLNFCYNDIVIVFSWPLIWMLGINVHPKSRRNPSPFADCVASLWDGHNASNSSCVSGCNSPSALTFACKLSRYATAQLPLGLLSDSRRKARSVAQFIAGETIETGVVGVHFGAEIHMAFFIPMEVIHNLRLTLFISE